MNDNDGSEEYAVIAKLTSNYLKCILAQRRLKTEQGSLFIIQGDCEKTQS